MILAIVQVIAAVSAGLLIAGWLFQQIGERRDRRRFPPPGRLIAIGECKLHVVEQGSGGPAVVLEAGLAASSLSWSRVQSLIAKFTRVVSYDRAGLGWSTPVHSARTLQQMASELAALLETAKAAPPYILVGHSFGALIVRAFAHRYADLVAGIVLVDPVSIDHWAECSAADQRRLALGAKLSRRGAWLARLGVVRFALAVAGWRRQGLTRGIARASAGKATGFLQRLVGEVQKLPPEAIRVARAHWSEPKPFLAMARYLEVLPACAKAAEAMPIPANIPLIILSAETATERELQERDLWMEHRRLAYHLKIEGTGHWLHLEKPQIVAEAVKDIVERERSRSVSHGVDNVVHPDAKA